MADQMQAIKRRMKSVGSTERITNAMKLVSAARLKQAGNRHEHIRKNISGLELLFRDILEREKDAPGVYREEREGRTLCLVFSGSKGLCGNYNASVIKAAEQEAGKDPEGILFLPLGTKAAEFFAREGLPVLDVAPACSDTMEYGEIQELSKELLEKYREGTFTNIKFIHASYLNSISHEVRVRKVLPFGEEKTEEGGSFMEYDRDRQAFFADLAEEYLALCIYSALSESVLCEHSARRMAMKNASDNAKEMLGELSVYYNRARQAAITNEIIEIIAGAESQKTRR